jgi:hypothetical protein
MAYLLVDDVSVDELDEPLVDDGDVVDVLEPLAPLEGELDMPLLEPLVPEPLVPEPEVPEPEVPEPLVPLEPLLSEPLAEPLVLVSVELVLEPLLGEDVVDEELEPGVVVELSRVELVDVLAVWSRLQPLTAKPAMIARTAETAVVDFFRFMLPISLRLLGHSGESGALVVPGVVEPCPGSPCWPWRAGPCWPWPPVSP